MNTKIKKSKRKGHLKRGKDNFLAKMFPVYNLIINLSIIYIYRNKSLDPTQRVSSKWILFMHMPEHQWLLIHIGLYCVQRLFLFQCKGRSFVAIYHLSFFIFHLVLILLANNVIFLIEASWKWCIVHLFLPFYSGINYWANQPILLDMVILPCSQNSHILQTTLMM